MSKAIEELIKAKEPFDIAIEEVTKAERLLNLMFENAAAIVDVLYPQFELGEIYSLKTELTTGTHRLIQNNDVLYLYDVECRIKEPLIDVLLRIQRNKRGGIDPYA